jgi:hypothetical protein
MYSYAETKKIPNNSDLLIKISEPIDFNSSNFQYAKTKRLKALNYLNEITK